MSENITAHGLKKKAYAVMLRLARDKTFAHSIGDAGRETFARGRYDWKGNAERHATLYRELLARWR